MIEKLSTISEKLNISDDRIHEIDKYIAKLCMGEIGLKSDDLLQIKEKFKENELIYAVYSYGYYWGHNDWGR